uniref:Uncharacterized protein n=1 Tax=Castor canadensis TaxID=51338 RepID=A0A8C0WN38_CASCN
MKREVEGSEPAAGSALCTNRGGACVSLSLASALPAPWRLPPFPAPPPLFLIPSPSDSSSSSPLPFLSLPSSLFCSSFCWKRKETDRVSHTLAPATVPKFLHCLYLLHTSWRVKG